MKTQTLTYLVTVENVPEQVRGYRVQGDICVSAMHELRRLYGRDINVITTIPLTEEERSKYECVA